MGEAAALEEDALEAPRRVGGGAGGAASRPAGAALSAAAQRGFPGDGEQVLPLPAGGALPQGLHQRHRLLQMRALGPWLTRRQAPPESVGRGRSEAQGGGQGGAP